MLSGVVYSNQGCLIVQLASAFTIDGVYEYYYKKGMKYLHCIFLLNGC